MSVYDYFDDIVCINLDISTERKKHAQMYFDKLNIPARFFTAKKHPKGGMYGCFDSHIQILKEAYDRGLNNVLVFEDDFLPTASYSEEKMQKAVDFMKGNDDWDIMYFGYGIIKEHMGKLSTIMDALNTYDEFIFEYKPLCSQSLCYNRKAIENILTHYHEYIGIVHFDMYLSEHTELKSYCVVPMLFDQNWYFPHNNQSNEGIGYVARLCYPFKAFTKFHYRCSCIKYFTNKYHESVNVMYIIFFIILFYAIKKIYIKDSKVL